jgi:hypothetical protein
MIAPAPKPVPTKSARIRGRNKLCSPVSKKLSEMLTSVDGPGGFGGELKIE